MDVENNERLLQLVPINPLTFPPELFGDITREGRAKPSSDTVGLGLDFAKGQLTAAQSVKHFVDGMTLEDKFSILIIADDFRFNQFNTSEDEGQSNQSADYQSSLHSWIGWVFDPAEVEFRLSIAARIVHSRLLSNFRKEQALHHLGITHGALVLIHTLNLLEPFGVKPTSNTEDGRVGYFETKPSEPTSYTIPFVSSKYDPFNFQIVALDVNELDTGEIANSLEHTVNLARAKTDRLVVNMSFSLVPRGLFEKFKALQADDSNDIETYGDFWSFIRSGSFSTEVFTEDLRLLIENLSSPDRPVDPLLAYVDDLMAASSQVQNDYFAFIASSGNYSLPFPFYPAAWPNFVSISAARPGFNAIADYSNHGEISAPGDVIVSPSASVRGTSFAAPLVSVLTALNFTQQTPTTTLSELDTLKPSDWQLSFEDRLFRTNVDISAFFPTQI